MEMQIAPCQMSCVNLANALELASEYGTPVERKDRLMGYYLCFVAGLAMGCLIGVGAGIAAILRRPRGDRPPATNKCR